jgi:hypothetical protein
VTQLSLLHAAELCQMDDHSSTCSTSLLTLPLGEWPQYLVLIIAAGKFAATLDKIQHRMSHETMNISASTA